jgi:MinD-like ATPase involved in chromosome partitioning or flagellar assembly
VAAWALPPDADQTSGPPVPPGPGAAAAPTAAPGTPAQLQPTPQPPLLEQLPPPAPTLDSLLAARSAPAGGPATIGWRATVRTMTGGLLKLQPGADEIALRADTAAVQRPLNGPRTIAVVNPKGGAHKTTATLLLAATLGAQRGGYTLAWDNNETRGTLGWRAQPGRHTRTAVDLLRDLDRFDDARGVRAGDLDGYVRSQGDARFDVLASDEDAASAASVDREAFLALHRSLSRFYRIIVVDTGNNMRAGNWQAALDKADQLVIVSTVREDTGQSAAWMVDALRAAGRHHAVRTAVTVLSAASRNDDRGLADRLRRHFGQLTRAVVEVPHDDALVAGGPVDLTALSPASRQAWLRVTAAVVDGL